MKIPTDPTAWAAAMNARASIRRRKQRQVALFIILTICDLLIWGEMIRIIFFE